MPIEHISRVLEVGSGTGRLTRAIHKRLPREATLFCVERNPKFCAYLKEIFPNSNVVVINERFENLLSFHSEIGVALVDCIILSLPMALVPDVLRQLWLDIAHTILKKDGYLFIHQFIPVIKQYLENPRWVMESRKWIVGLPPYCFEVYRKRVDS